MNQSQTIPSPSTYQGIQVIIRLKPNTQQIQQQSHNRSVLISPSQQNTIIVQTLNKKQYFSFDYIASEKCSQYEIFQYVGMPMINQSIKGYNCSIFAYGQTGAGKTYSIMGNHNQFLQNIYCDSRGILPRLLEELFSALQSNKQNKYDVKCSYLEIYNEQIIDLLNKQVRTCQIREDFKKGIYVQGLSQQQIYDYQSATEFIFKGLKNRKIASTSMNSQSSRSHTIFTILMKIFITQDSIQKQKFAKINIVDLAGSQRQKFSKVSGQRLREGCNINKSLHSLGNVINSLVESIKKKKYIPYRDSKLTFFLKDSLGGNSKTKLLANINTDKQFLSDTLSTLMFAKRVKILKIRVQANQNIGDNFESLRNEIKRLRQELAQTKYIKNININESQVIFDKDFSRERIIVNDTILQDELNKESVIALLYENEKRNRTIIQLYQQRIKLYEESKLVHENKHYKQLFQQKKLLQIQNVKLLEQIRNIPRFSKIYEENIKIKRQMKELNKNYNSLIQEQQCLNIELHKNQNNINLLKNDIKELQKQLENQIPCKNQNDFQKTSNKSMQILRLTDQKFHRKQSITITQREDMKSILNRQNQMLEQYEIQIENLKSKFQEYKKEFIDQYNELEKLYENEKKQKNELKKMRKKQVNPNPKFSDLEDQNQYLKLNIMELQNQIIRLQQEEFKKSVELKTQERQNEKLRNQLQILESKMQDQGLNFYELSQIMNKMKLIQESLINQNKQLQQRGQQDMKIIIETRQQILKLTKEKCILSNKNEMLLENNKIMKQKLNQLKFQNEIQQNNKIKTCWTELDEEIDNDKSNDNELIKLNNDLLAQIQKYKNDIANLHKQLNEEKQINLDHMRRLQFASHKILSLTKQNKNLKQQLTTQKQQLKILETKFKEIKLQNQSFNQKYKLMEIQLHRNAKQYEKSHNFCNKIRQQFKKDEYALIQQYKLLKKRNQQLNHQLNATKKSDNKSQKKCSSVSGVHKSSVEIDPFQYINKNEPYKKKVNIPLAPKYQKVQQRKILQSFKKEQKFLKQSYRDSFHAKKLMDTKPMIQLKSIDYKQLLAKADQKFNKLIKKI